MDHTTIEVVVGVDMALIKKLQLSLTALVNGLDTLALSGLRVVLSLCGGLALLNPTANFVLDQLRKRVPFSDASSLAGLDTDRALQLAPLELHHRGERLLQTSSTSHDVTSLGVMMLKHHGDALAVPALHESSQLAVSLAGSGSLAIGWCRPSCT